MTPTPYRCSNLKSTMKERAWTSAPPPWSIDETNCLTFLGDFEQEKDFKKNSRSMLATFSVPDAAKMNDRKYRIPRNPVEEQQARGTGDQMR